MVCLCVSLCVGLCVGLRVGLCVHSAYSVQPVEQRPQVSVSESGMNSTERVRMTVRMTERGAAYISILKNAAAMPSALLALRSFGSGHLGSGTSSIASAQSAMKASGPSVTRAKSAATPARARPA